MTVRLFVDKVPQTSTKADLEQMFSSYGAVEAIHLVPPSDTRTTARFAIVDMHSASGAQKAVVDMRNYALGEHNMTVMVSRTDAESLSEIAKLEPKYAPIAVSRIGSDGNLRRAS